MYCKNCGSKVEDGAKFCSVCGARQDGYNQYPPQYQTVYSYQKPLIERLRSKILILIVLWGIISALQYITGLYLIFSLEESMLRGIVTLVFAVFNTVSCVSDYEYRNRIAEYPVGIIEKYAPVGGDIATILYNTAVGGIFGAIISIYPFIIRRFVMKNAEEFKMIEAQYLHDKGYTDIPPNEQDFTNYGRGQYPEYITIYTVDGSSVSTRTVELSILTQQYKSHIKNGKIYLQKRTVDGITKQYFISEERYNAIISNENVNNDFGTVKI